MQKRKLDYFGSENPTFRKQNKQNHPLPIFDDEEIDYISDENDDDWDMSNIYAEIERGIGGVKSELLIDPIKYVTTHVHTFQPTYRTSNFCVYQSPIATIKIGELHEEEIVFHTGDLGESAGCVMECIFYTTDMNKIPGTFPFLKHTSCNKTMSIYVRKQDEYRLCDIDTKNWTLTMRMTCLILINQLIDELFVAGYIFKIPVNQGLISLYKNDQGHTRVMCNESEVLEKATNQLRDIPHTLKLIKMFFCITDTSLVLPLHILDNFDLDYIPLTKQSYSFTLHPYFVEKGHQLCGSALLSMPIVGRGTFGMVSVFDSNYVIKTIIEEGVAERDIIVRIQKSMDTGKLSPNGYLHTDAMWTCDGGVLSFCDYTLIDDDEFETKYTDELNKKHVLCVKQGFIKEAQSGMTFFNQHKFKTQSLYAFFAKILVLWSRLTTMAGVIHADVHLGNVLVKKAANDHSSQLTANETIHITNGKTTKTVNINCKSSYDVFLIDYGVATLLPETISFPTSICANHMLYLMMLCGIAKTVLEISDDETWTLLQNLGTTRGKKFDGDACVVNPEYASNALAMVIKVFDAMVATNPPS